MNGDLRQLDRQSPGDTGLDSVIDAVAREMTEAEPSGTLRARVLDEIAPGHRQAYAVPRWAWAGAAAVLTLAVASSVWLATRPADQAQEPARVAQSRPAPQQGPLAAPPTAERETATPAAAAATRTVAARAVRASEATLDEDSHHLPALAEIEPLRFTVVEPAALQVARLEVAPLTAMPSIEIPSLDPGSIDIQAADPKKEN